MSLAVQDIEKAITELPTEQLQQFHQWYEKFDAQGWDEQIKQDAMSGKLDNLAQMAVAEQYA